MDEPGSRFERDSTMNMRCLLVASVALFVAAPALADTIDDRMVPVGDVGNPNDSNGLGAVAYEYAFGKCDVTIGQYTAFLNAVAAFSGSASSYGTFDQTGSVYQWNDGDRSSGVRQIRGGAWYDNPEVPHRLSSSYALWVPTSDTGAAFGLRLAGAFASTVPETDPAGLGSVLALVGGALGLLERRCPRPA